MKGAYWDYETAAAQQREWPVPVWSRKPEIGRQLREAHGCYLLDNIDTVTPNFASHNVRSVAHAIVQAERRGIDPRAYEFQALYGMADDLKAALLQCGHRVREYCTIGELLPGMAYLVRRLLENTSNEGFLRIKNTGRGFPRGAAAQPGGTHRLGTRAHGPQASVERLRQRREPRLHARREPREAARRPSRPSNPAAWAGSIRS